MAYIEEGDGIPIVFLHGNPTSSYLWRQVLPHLKGFGRLIAPDLIGMGDSDKIPASEPDRYRFASHARYLGAFLNSVTNSREAVVLVLHDWGGALGFDWASKHPERVRGIAYMETFVRPLTLADLPESFHPTLRAVRSREGERLVLDENMFIEKMLPAVTQRVLSNEEMAEYRRPIPGAWRGAAANLTMATRSAAVRRTSGCHRADERLRGMAENERDAQAFHRRRPGRVHHRRCSQICKLVPEPGDRQGDGHALRARRQPGGSGRCDQDLAK